MPTEMMQNLPKPSDGIPAFGGEEARGAASRVAALDHVVENFGVGVLQVHDG